MNWKQQLVMLMTLTLCATSPAAKSFDLAKSESLVKFTATGTPGGFKINGTSEQKAGVISGKVSEDGGNLTITSTFSLAQLDTGIGLRTSHMKDNYLEVGKFPNATLTIAKINATEAKTGNPTKFEGNLELHGQKKPITGTIRFLDLSEKLSLQAEFSVTITDFGIPVPSFAGVSVNTTIPVTVEVKDAAIL